LKIFIERGLTERISLKKFYPPCEPIELEEIIMSITQSSRNRGRPFKAEGATENALSNLLPKIVRYRVQKASATTGLMNIYQWLHTLLDTVLHVAPSNFAPEERPTTTPIEYLKDYVSGDLVKEELIRLLRKKFRPLDNKDLLHVAAAIGSLDAVKHHISGSTDKYHLLFLQAYSVYNMDQPFFKNPIFAAATNGPTAIVGHFLDTIKLFDARIFQQTDSSGQSRGRKRSIEPWVRDALGQALKAVILNGHVDVTRLLLRFAKEHLLLKKLLADDDRGCFVTYAVQSGSIGMVRLMYSSDKKLLMTPNDFEVICSHGHGELVRTLFEQKLLGPADKPSLMRQVFEKTSFAVARVLLELSKPSSNEPELAHEQGYHTLSSQLLCRTPLAEDCPFLGHFRLQDPISFVCTDRPSMYPLVRLPQNVA
jgi:hypothetical protein